MTYLASFVLGYALGYGGARFLRWRRRERAALPVDPRAWRPRPGNGEHRS